MTGWIGISLGDITGIGPEVTLKALATETQTDETRYLLIGDAEHVRALNRRLGLNLPLQTYGGKDVYPTLDEKAAHLLYFAVKNHPFVDGNKRIGALMFLLFLIENHYLLNKKGERKVNDAALTALTLLVA